MQDIDTLTHSMGNNLSANFQGGGKKINAAIVPSYIPPYSSNYLLNNELCILF